MGWEVGFDEDDPTAWYSFPLEKNKTRDKRGRYVERT
jgi:hypothetical protein